MLRHKYLTNYNKNIQREMGESSEKQSLIHSKSNNNYNQDQNYSQKERLQNIHPRAMISSNTNNSCNSSYFSKKQTGASSLLDCRFSSGGMISNWSLNNTNSSHEFANRHFHSTNQHYSREQFSSRMSVPINRTEMEFEVSSDEQLQVT